MHPAIEMMLKKYQLQKMDDYTNALKEIIQEIALLGLWRSKFFEKASFYDGTALRIFYKLNRFSEDLDFSLLEKDKSFNLDKYNEAIMTELAAFGFEVEIQKKIKSENNNIASAVIKANTKQQFLNVLAPTEFRERIHNQQTIKIKMEIDIYPPLNFNTEIQMLLNPIPFEVRLFQKPDLFATKVHAILCRPWVTRIKGRDWFDFLWYVSNNIKLRISHLETRLRESNVWTVDSNLTRTDVLQLLTDKISQIDFEDAKKDVRPFIQNNDSIALWSKPFFQKLVENLQCE